VDHTSEHEAAHHLDGTSDERLVTRLLAKRRLDSDTGCWLWQGRRDRWGYGRITVSHRRWSVHRLAAHLYLGLDPESHLHVLHRCHTPPCFRPDHLYLGTNADNIRDRVGRREKATGDWGVSPLGCDRSFSWQLLRLLAAGPVGSWRPRPNTVDRACTHSRDRCSRGRGCLVYAGVRLSTERQTAVTSATTADPAGVPSFR